MRRKRSNKWSNSRLNTYQNCPKQYKFKYIETGNVEEFLSISIIVGSVFHNVIEKMYKDFYLKGIVPLEEILEYFNNEWEKKQTFADSNVIPLKICNFGFSDHFSFFLKKKNINGRVQKTVKKYLAHVI